MKGTLARISASGNDCIDISTLRSWIGILALAAAQFAFI
jgi:hypothetical protein